MASQSSRSNMPRLSLDILLLLPKLVDNPETYLNLSLTFKYAMSKFSLDRAIYLDAQRWRKTVPNVPTVVQQRATLFDRKQYKPMIAYYMRIGSPVEDIRRMLDIYQSVFPEFGTAPFIYIAMETGNLDVFFMMIDGDLAPPPWIAPRGSYFKYACRRCPDISLVTWLLQHDTRPDPLALVTLFDRGMLKRGDYIWIYLEERTILFESYPLNTIYEAENEKSQNKEVAHSEVPLIEAAHGKESNGKRDEEEVTSTGSLSKILLLNILAIFCLLWLFVMVSIRIDSWLHAGQRAKMQQVGSMLMRNDRFLLSDF